MKMSLIAGLVGFYLAFGALLGAAQEEHDHHDKDHHAEDSAAGELGHEAADEEEAAKIEVNLGKLSPEDRDLADAQGFCPVMTDSPLGAMGPPIKLTVNNETIFLCCEGCQKKALANPEKTLATVKKLTAMVEQRREIAANMAKLAPEDRKLAMEQGYCAVMTDSPLGSMGAPIKVNVNNQSVFVCCKGCQKKATANAEKTLATVEELKAKVKQDRDIAASFAKLSPGDRSLARAQGYCVVMADNPLGTMGAPIKVMAKDQPVFLCCKGCQRKALANPDKTLAMVAELRKKVEAEAAKE